MLLNRNLACSDFGRTLDSIIWGGKSVRIEKIFVIINSVVALLDIERMFSA